MLQRPSYERCSLRVVVHWSMSFPCNFSRCSVLLAHPRIVMKPSFLDSEKVFPKCSVKHSLVPRVYVFVCHDLVTMRTPRYPHSHNTHRQNTFSTIIHALSHAHCSPVTTKGVAEGHFTERATLLLTTKIIITADAPSISLKHVATDDWLHVTQSSYHELTPCELQLLSKVFRFTVVQRVVDALCHVRPYAMKGNFF